MAMQNKKLYKVAALSLLGLIGLTACDKEVIAPVGGKDDPIITIDDKDNEVYDNIATSFYDQIREGSLASDVLDEVLYRYAESVLGRYNAVSSKTKLADGEITLKAAAAAAKSGAAGKTVIDAFVKSHKAYWSVNADGKRVGDDGQPVAEDAEASAREIARVAEKWDSIEERIAEAMYDKIASGTYSEHNIFSERKFLASLRFDSKKVVDYKSATNLYSGLLSPDVEPKDVFTKFLNRENYQPNAGIDKDESSNVITYIEEEIIPTIYRSLLTEQYLLDETYNTLGRSYARQVNAITIANNNNYDLAAPYLMDMFVKEINKEGSDITLDTFKKYANVWKGVTADLTADEIAIADELASEEYGAFVKATSKDGEEYYQGTKYGDMMENYDKIDENPLLTDTSIEADFTGSNSYRKEIGKQYKADEIAIVDYTTTGWFTKSSGVEGLPSNITNILFNVGVANALDHEDDTKGEKGNYDRWQNGVYSEKNDYNKYVAKINGKYYLKNNSAEQGDPYNDILFYDHETKTYYIVQVVEAVNSTKLSKTSTKNYEALHDAETMEEYVNHVLKIVAKGDSYDSLSKKHWLEEMDLKYHDTVIYDYFKTNFPELFD